MKPLLINTCDIEGGAARAAFRLHKGLQSIGLDSRMLVGQKVGDDASVIVSSSKWTRGFSLLRPTLDALPLIFYPRRDRSIFSSALFPDGLSAEVASNSPNIVNLHWVAGGFLRIETLQKLRTPIVWTLHDMWAFTGGCHYDTECGRYRERCGVCPRLGSKRQNDLSYRIWKRKKRTWQGLDMTIVTPSRWLSRCARSSSLFSDKRVEVIPYGLDTSVFKPIDMQTARDIWGLPHDKRLILFGAMDASSDRRKGFQFLAPALKMLAHDGFGAELIVFGASKPAEPPDLRFKVHYIGRLHDDVSLALLYSAADIFVAPSVQDNLPNTIMESLSCGRPVVAFDVGGIPDMVEHKKNGYLAKPFDTEDLARGIQWVLGDEDRAQKLSKASREKAVKEYSMELQAKRYLALYQDILERKR